jgi:hypothetical protein
MTRYLLLALAAGGLALWGTPANANEPSAKPALAGNSAVPIQHAIRTIDGTDSADVTEVQWRRYHRSYYGGWGHPYYGGYRTFYQPYGWGYRGGWGHGGWGHPGWGHRGFYRGWDPYWGGGWGGYYRPRSGIWFGIGL